MHGVEHDVAPHVGTPAVGVLVLLGRIENFAQAIDGDAHLAHVAEDAPEAAQRPGDHGVVGDEHRELPEGEVPEHRLPRTQHHDQKHLQRRDEVAHAPVGAHHAAEPHPFFRKFVVLLVEVFRLERLAAERAHHAHAGQVLLHGGGEPALRLVGVAEALGDQGEEYAGIADDDRDKRDGDPRQLRAHREHPRDGGHHQHHRAEELQHLIGQKVAQHLDVGGAALDDVAGLDGDVPGVGQALDMAVELVPQAAQRALAAQCDSHAVEIGERARQHREHKRQGGEQRQMRPQRFAAARLRDGRAQKRGQVEGGVAQHAVHQHPDDLRRQEAEEYRQDRRRRGHGQPAEAAPEHGGQKRRPAERLFRFSCSGCFHVLAASCHSGTSYLITIA
jgi:hypothetical protein